MAIEQLGMRCVVCMLGMPPLMSSPVAACAGELGCSVMTAVHDAGITVPDC